MKKFWLVLLDMSQRKSNEKINEERKDPGQAIDGMV
jgi:hypothetical protein